MYDSDLRRINSGPIVVTEDGDVRRGSGVGWAQQPRDGSGPEADRPELWLQWHHDQCRRTGGRDWRVHYAGGRAGVLWEGDYAHVVQRYTFRFGRPECASGRGAYADWFLQHE